MATGAERFTQAGRLGLIGDTHADLSFALRAMDAISHRDVRVFIVLGDFGFIWGKDRSGVQALSARAEELDGTVLFVDGNHEDFAALNRFPVADDRVRWVAPSVGHLPRGSRFNLSGITVAAMGGANSIDKWRRTRNITWWEQEQITNKDLDRLGTDPVDVLLGHDAPEPLPMLDQHLWSTKKYWAMPELAYAAQGRRQYTRAFRAVRPKLCLGGHYHHFVDQIVHVDEDDVRFDGSVRIFVFLLRRECRGLGLWREEDHAWETNCSVFGR